jgi:hypothetical protein
MRIQLTKNFESNLDLIEQFWSESDFSQEYDRLLDDLTEILIPNLEQYPHIGRPFLSLAPDSVEASARQDTLKKSLKKIGKTADVRQYVSGDYLVLYALVGEVIYLLSIRHHKQISFDFEHLWKL